MLALLRAPHLLSTIEQTGGWLYTLCADAAST